MYNARRVQIKSGTATIFRGTDREPKLRCVKIGEPMKDKIFSGKILGNFKVFKHSFQRGCCPRFCNVRNLQ